jgi:tetratricopeptide (TPR) repeat protein
MVLVVLASLMAGMAIYLYVHKHHHRQAVATAGDAGELQMNVIDAAPLEVEPDAAERIAVAVDAAVIAPRPDAAVHVATVIDAGVLAPRPDAAVRVALAPDAGVDRNKEASRLKDEAASALADGDTARALDLAEQSLQLRKTAQAYLVEARALQRSGRTDDAITAATAARDLAPGYYMTHHELGMILMSARRNADARPELEKYLELAPNDKDADTVRQLLSAPSP